MFSATEEEMQEAMSAMEDIDELAGGLRQMEYDLSWRTALSVQQSEHCGPLLKAPQYATGNTPVRNIRTGESTHSLQL